MFPWNKKKEKKSLESSRPQEQRKICQVRKERKGNTLLCSFLAFQSGAVCLKAEFLSSIILPMERIIFAFGTNLVLSYSVCLC